MATLTISITGVPLHHDQICIPYSAIGKYWQKVYYERIVGKYLANLHLNKIICAYKSIANALSA